ncbi:MAG: hypothetical protein RJA26_518, partial [Actinomycetota bacterium]
ESEVTESSMETIGTEDAENSADKVNSESK